MAKKILVIGDEEILLNLLKKKLSKEGYKTFIVRDGGEGLQRMKELRPDLILLDITMPGMGGFEVMEEMAKDKELKKIPVIVISDSGQSIELDKAQKLGAKDWLVKTEFDPPEVIKKVVKQIGKPFTDFH